MEQQFTSLTVDGQGVAWLWLDKPQVHNAFDDRLIAELNGHLERLHRQASSAQVRALVLGSQGKHFSAGADLGWMRRMVGYDFTDNLADSQELARLMGLLDSMPCPVIGRVQGAAFGGAVGLAACCDVVVASEHAKFCLSEVKIGLSPAVISPYVQVAIGVQQMRRYALTGEVIDSTRALALGLAHEVVEHDQLDQEVQTILEALHLGSPQAQRRTKALLATVQLENDPDRRRDYTCQVISELRVSDEGQEGLASFFDRRPAKWVETPQDSAMEQG